MKHISLFILLAMLVSCAPDPSGSVVHEFSHDKNDIKTYNLVNAQVAHDWLTNSPEKYIPIQVSKEAGFHEGHIPSAINIWRPDYGSDVKEPYGGLIPSKDKLQSLLQDLGFEKGKTLLLYDLKANVDALRFAWVLNLYGFDDFKLINGGLKNWKENNLPITKVASVKPTKSNYQLKDHFENGMIAYADDVLAAIKDTTVILIDTREEYEFKGLPFIQGNKILPFKKGASNRGSIPTSVHLNWSILADLKGDHRIKSERDLRFDLAQKNITPDKQIILYCQSGSRTSHSYYVLKHVLGYPNVKNYDGSWIEWSYLNKQNPKYVIQQLAEVQEFENKMKELDQIIGKNE